MRGRTRRAKRFHLFLVWTLVVMSMAALSLIGFAQEVLWAPDSSTALQITAPVNVYAHVFKAIEVPSDAQELLLEAKIKTTLLSGSSWTPHVGIYFADDTFMGGGHQQNGLTRIRGLGRQKDGQDVTQNITIDEDGTWVSYRLRVTNSERELFVRTDQEEEWTLIGYTAAGMSAPPVEIWIGKGIGGTGTYPAPHLDNSYSTPGALDGVTYITDVVLTVDGNVVYSDDFSSLDGWDSHADPEYAEYIRFDSVEL